MKLKTVISNFLTNKWTLNIVSVLSLFTLIGYLMIRNFNAIAYFIALSLLLFYFSKNMIIVLGVPLILVNLFVYKNVIKEGLTNNTKTPDNKVVGSKKNTNSKLNYEKRTPQGLPKTKIDSDTTLNSTIDSSDSNVNTDESFEVGRPKRGGGYNIDYASTVEDAYDELNKIIGGEGIKRLTTDTQGLMKQQLQLAEAMKSMGPLIKGMAPLMQQAQGILGGMKDQEGLGGIMEMAKKISNQ
jgi:hypothetical protein